LLPLLTASIDGDLENVEIEIDSRVSVTVILASGGYPGKYETGKRISGLESAAKRPGVQIFHAATRREGDEIISTGGRVLAVTAVSESIEQARAQAYTAVEEIHFEGCRFRRDIALPLSHE
jgi:phosphoribosylamine--glycine ligase